MKSFGFDLADFQGSRDAAFGFRSNEGPLNIVDVIDIDYVIFQGAEIGERVGHGAKAYR
jgi:hypothetical protein